MSKIYEPQGRAREYSPLALNLYKGCTHGCVYCYVPKMFKRWNSDYDHAECRQNADFADLEKSAKKLQGCNKQILLSFTGDPYPFEDDTTRTALEILNKYNHKVAILTKGGGRCLKDLDIFKAFGNRIKVGATLSFITDDLSEKWEPGAALPSERLDTLKTLHENGIKTWASFEPVIDPDEALKLINESHSYLDHVKIGKLNGNKEVDSKVDWAKFLGDVVTLCRSLNLKFYIKESLQKFEKESSVVLTDDEKNKDYLNL